MKKAITLFLVIIIVFSIGCVSYAEEKSTNTEEYKTLSVGSRGKEVTQLQERLKELGYLEGSADGDYGNMTATAVTAFQYAAGLEKTGSADKKTQEALFSEEAPEQTEENKFYPVKSIHVEQHEYTIFNGDSVTPIFTFSPENATQKELEYTIESDTKCVEVDEKGVFTAIDDGVAKVTATAKDGSGKSTYFYLYCEPECPVVLEGLGTGTYQGNLLALTFKNKCHNTTIKDIYFDITLKAYNGDTISSGSYHTDTHQITAGQTYVLKRTLNGVAYASSYVITITGVELSDGTEYIIPFFSRDITSWG